MASRKKRKQRQKARNLQRAAVRRNAPLDELFRNYIYDVVAGTYRGEPQGILTPVDRVPSLTFEELEARQASTPRQTSRRRRDKVNWQQEGF